MKTAIVTGASRGIGQQAAETLAADGYHVALIARGVEALEAVASGIEERGGKATVCACDVSSEEDVERVVATLKDQWKSLDLLFNNAGIFLPGSAELPTEDFKKIFEINLFGPFYFLKHTVPWFTEQQDGTILNLSSLAGNIGFAGVGGYAASKFALRGLGESLHRELEPLGIRVTTISPSWVNTVMGSVGPMDGAEMIQPEDVSKTIQYILQLGPTATVREIVISCRAALEAS